MSEITHQDLINIVTAAVGMAKQDHLLSDQEKVFLKQLMTKANVTPSELNSKDIDFKALAGQLSSKKAKQVFLLTLAAVAKADLKIDEAEVQFLKEMAATLEVGFVEVEMHSRAILEKMVLSHLQD